MFSVPLWFYLNGPARRRNSVSTATSTRRPLADTSVTPPGAGRTSATMSKPRGTAATAKICATRNGFFGESVTVVG